MTITPSPLRRRALAPTAIVAAATLALVGCGGQQAQQPGASAAGSGDGCTAPAAQIAIATGNATGVYYVLGGGISEILGTETALRAAAAETGASVQNIEQLVAGDFDLAFSTGDTAFDAVAGTGSFDEPQPVEALGLIHRNYAQVIVRSDANVESLADLEGATVSTGSPGSGTEVIALRLLEAAGLDPAQDVTAQRLDLATSIDGLRGGAVDAVIWAGGLPTPNVTELFTTDGDSFEILDISGELEAMQELNPIYLEATIPAETYGLDDDVQTIAVPNVLLVRDDMDDAVACDITRAIWSNVDRLETVHPAGGELDAEAARETGEIPLAPGAERALDELVGE